MLQISAAGKEGVAFGLYTTTGRAVSFLAPWLFFVFVDWFGTDRAGIGGLCVVLTAGLIAMLWVRAPRTLPPSQPARPRSESEIPAPDPSPA
jgi:UMF1 family MFS transporter